MQQVSIQQQWQMLNQFIQEIEFGCAYIWDSSIYDWVNQFNEWKLKKVIHKANILQPKKRLVFQLLPVKKMHYFLEYNERCC